MGGSTATGGQAAGPGADAAGILIVDDRRSNLVALEALLEPLGRRIELAQSGEEALRLLLSGRFALILLDVQMPEMDGFELARYIRGRPQTRRTPIIFVTAVSTATQHIFDGYQAGAVDYLLKPVDPVILRSKVTVFIELFESAQRLQRHAELQGVHDSLALAQRAGRSGVWDWDVAAGRLYLSPEYADLVGLGPGAAAADGALLATVDPRDQERIGGLLRSFLERGETWDEEFRIVHPRRGVRWLAARGVLSRDASGGAERFTGIAVDVTDRHLAEDRLRRLHAAASDLSAALTPSQVAEVVIDHGRRATGATGAWIVLSRDDARPAAASPGCDPDAADLERARAAGAGRDPIAWGPAGATRLALPLGPDEGAGILGLILDRPGPLDDEELGFMAAFAAQCGQALERSRLYHAERESRRRTEALQTATAALTAAITRREVGEAIVRESMRAFGATSASARVVDPDAQALETIAVAGFADGLARPLGTGPLGEASPTADAARARRPLYLESASDVDARYPGSGTRERWPRREALAALPLLTGGRAIGVLGLRFDVPRAFSGDDREAMEAFARIAGQSAARASLHEAETRRQAASSLIAEASLALDADFGVSERLRRLAPLLVPRLGDACCIELRDGDEASEVVAIAGRTPALEALVRELRERDPLDAGAAPGLRPGIKGGGPLSSALVAPITARGRRTGVIAVFSHDPRRYDGQDLQLLEDLGGRAGLALDNARLYEAQLGVALTLQKALLPSRLPVLRDLSLAARYLSAAVHTQASGDWYEAVELPGGPVVLAVGDVVGRGTEAAAVMGQLRSAMRAYALAGMSPGAALEKLSAFAAGVPGAAVSTAAAVEVDLERGRLRYACAGHPPPLLIEAGGTTRLLEGGRGPALGVVTHGYREADVPFGEGSALVLYTDGLVERRGERLDAGLERLANEAAAASPARSAELCERLVSRLVDRRSIRDDVAVLVATRETAVLPLALSVPADPRSLAEVRSAVRDWLAAAEVGRTTSEDIVLACGEALANSVEHAYADHGPGTVEVELSLASDRAVELEVRDHGHWRPPSDDPGLRGRGLFLMRRLMDRVDVGHDARGTRVSMRLRHRAAIGPGAGRPPAAEPGATASSSPTFTGGVPAGIVEGEFDASRTGELRAEIDRVARQGTDVALDLTGVSYIDSSGVRLLVDVGAGLAASGASLRLTAAPASAARRIIDLCGLGAMTGIEVEDGEPGGPQAD